MLALCLIHRMHPAWAGNRVTGPVAVPRWPQAAASLNPSTAGQVMHGHRMSARPGGADAAGTSAPGRGPFFTQLHTERQQAQAQLDRLTATTATAADPAILDEIPYAGDILPDLPPPLKARLFDAFDLCVLWNKTGNQATIRAEITDTTLTALPGILNPRQDGYHDTVAAGNPGTMGQLTQTPVGV
jgi:hypothetical protein